MSVQSEIDRISTNVDNSYTALSGLGATMPTAQNSNNLAATINSIKAVQYAAQSLSQEEQAQARSNIGASSAADIKQSIQDEKGVSKGIAELDAQGKILQSQLPSYVDDVIEGTLATFPKVGETGKIYVDTDTSLSYRWGGSAYVEISPSLALGTTDNTAFRGDWGKTLQDQVGKLSFVVSSSAPPPGTPNTTITFVI